MEELRSAKRKELHIAAACLELELSTYWQRHADPGEQIVFLQRNYIISRKFNWD